MAKCSVCFRHCEIAEGRIGFCGGRVCREGEVVCGNYGAVTYYSLAMTAGVTYAVNFADDFAEIVIVISENAGEFTEGHGGIMILDI